MTRELEARTDAADVDVEASRAPSLDGVPSLTGAWSRSPSAVLALQRAAGNRATFAALRDVRERQVARFRPTPRFTPKVTPRITPPKVTPKVTPIPKVKPTPKVTPTPEVAPTPPSPTPTPTPTPTPGTTLPPPLPVGPVPDPSPDPQLAPDPNVKPQPTPKQKEGEETKKKGCGTKELPFTVLHHEPGPLGQGKRVKASPLTKCPPVEGKGSLPSQSIYKAQFDCLAQRGAGDFWVRMHLLHGMTERAPVRNLHGPGNKMWNLIIGDKWVNGQMSLDLERKVIPQVYDQDAVLWYETTVDHYIAGNEYFVRTFRVRYGKYDTVTGTEGPELDNWVYAASKWPPRCPPSLAAGFPAAFPLIPPAKNKSAFQSTFEVCYQRLTTRVFNVPEGGVTLQLSGDWVSRSEDATTECPTDDYEVTLHRSNLLLDDEISTAKVPVGGQSVDWEPLPPGDYYFTIDAPPHSPLCCLRGDIVVSTFYSPMPMQMPLDPSMIA